MDLTTGVRVRLDTLQPSHRHCCSSWNNLTGQQISQIPNKMFMQEPFNSHFTSLFTRTTSYTSIRLP